MPNQSSHQVTIPPQRRKRSERVALHSATVGPISRAISSLRRDHFGVLLTLMAATSVALCLVIRAWDPPFPFALNDVADRAIVSKAHFTVPSVRSKMEAEEKARSGSPLIFINDPKPLVQLRESFWLTVSSLVKGHDFEKLDAQGQEDWLRFLRPRGKDSIPEGVDPAQAFAEFVAHFEDDQSLATFNNRLTTALIEFEVRGLIASGQFNPVLGQHNEVLVYPPASAPDKATPFRVTDIVIRDPMQIKEPLRKNLPRSMQDDVFIDQLSNWLYPRLPDTLQLDSNATIELQQSRVAEVGEVSVSFVPGQILIEAGASLGPDELMILWAEYRAAMKDRKDAERLLRFHAIVVSVFILLAISWSFMRRLERRRPKTPQSFTALMFGMILTAILAQTLHRFSLTNVNWLILSLLLFVMVVSITYSWELAIVFTAILTFVLVFGAGGGNGVLLVLLAVTMTTAIQLGRLRSRRKLVVVCFISGLVAFAMTVSVGMLSGRAFTSVLLLDAGTNFLCATLAGFIMTGLLPFLEEPFGILTDMSLLELGDVSHPLLQSLIRLAPATYGHSMQVGTIAETAAEAIGARGLLTRVGAYFHDIGKIMKPEYFSENQGGLENIHDQLEPQVSTIVLIAHVKDGIDLARQHRLPKPLIDLIEQHHGTSLVGYFYNRASSKACKDEPQVEESTYRYPGPKPQTKEASILMIADTCESACRSMGSAATPGKIENRVRILIKQKLDDGQFDDSGLTLRELKIIENSVIKSILAAMHGRIKYPGQEEEGTKSDIVKPEKPASDVLPLKKGSA